MSKENDTSPPSGLTAKQTRFVAEYLIDLNATQAAIRCGYSANGAKTQAHRLITNANVAAAIAAGAGKQLEALEVTGAKVKARLAAIGFQDIRQLFDEAGNLRPIHTLSDDAAAMIAGVEVIIKNAAAGDGVTDRVHKVKAVDPVRCLEMLAKHFGLLTDKLEHSGSIAITHELPE